MGTLRQRGEGICFETELGFKASYALRPSLIPISVQFSSVQSLSRVRLFVTPWTAAHQAPCPSPTPGAGVKSKAQRWDHVPLLFLN